MEATKSSKTATKVLDAVLGIHNREAVEVGELLPKKYELGEHFDSDEWIDEVFNSIHEETTAQSPIHFEIDLKNHCCGTECLMYKDDSNKSRRPFLICFPDPRLTTQQWIDAAQAKSDVEDPCEGCGKARYSKESIGTAPPVLMVTLQANQAYSDHPLDEFVTIPVAGSRVCYKLMYRRGGQSEEVLNNGKSRADDSNSWYKMDDDREAEKCDWATVSKAHNIRFLTYAKQEQK